MEGIINKLRRTRQRVPHSEQNGFVQLFVSKRLLHGAAAALLGIFVPIFLYETMGNVLLGRRLLRAFVAALCTLIGASYASD